MSGTKVYAYSLAVVVVEGVGRGIKGEACATCARLLVNTINVAYSGDDLGIIRNYLKYVEVAEEDLRTLVLACAVIEACKVNTECKSGRLNAVCITATGDNVIHFLSYYELIFECLPICCKICSCAESGEVIERVLLTLVESELDRALHSRLCGELEANCLSNISGVCPDIIEYFDSAVRCSLYCVFISSTKVEAYALLVLNVELINRLVEVAEACTASGRCVNYTVEGINLL